jgi:hypothetical protein
VLVSVRAPARMVTPVSVGDQGQNLDVQIVDSGTEAAGSADRQGLAGVNPDRQAKNGMVA